MRFRSALALAAALFILPVLARADDAIPLWTKAQNLLVATQGDFDRAGYDGVAPHVADLEDALAHARDAFAAADASRPTRFVLASGPDDTLAALMIATTDRAPGVTQTVAVPNPYPAIGLHLGSYYNEMGRFDDAIRVIDLGLAARTIPDLPPKEQAPYLLSERGIAFASLKRLPEALDSFDQVLAFEDLPPKHHARVLRSRGAVLAELKRLDEAEKSYRDSLGIEPDNAHAKDGLDYVAALRSGQSPDTSFGIVPNEPAK